MKYMFICTYQGAGKRKTDPTATGGWTFRAGRTTTSSPQLIEAKDDAEAIKLVKKQAEELRCQKGAIHAKIETIIAVDHIIDKSKY